MIDIATRMREAAIERMEVQQVELLRQQQELLHRAQEARVLAWWCVGLWLAQAVADLIVRVCCLR